MSTPKPIDEVAAVFAQEYARATGEDIIGALLRSGAFHAIPNGADGQELLDMARHLEGALRQFESLHRERAALRIPPGGLFKAVDRSEPTRVAERRWAAGLPHHDASKRIMDVLRLSDVDDYFDWKVGGDGDNGEAAMFMLDEFFERHPTEPVLLCCETMKAQLSMVCDQHGDECPDQVVRRGKESGRLFLVAANATYDLLFCPWCGAHVQQSSGAEVPA